MRKWSCNISISRTNFLVIWYFTFVFGMICPQTWLAICFWSLVSRYFCQGVCYVTYTVSASHVLHDSDFCAKLLLKLHISSKIVFVVLMAFLGFLQVCASVLISFLSSSGIVTNELCKDYSVKCFEYIQWNECSVKCLSQKTTNQCQAKLVISFLVNSHPGKCTTIIVIGACTCNTLKTVPQANLVLSQYYLGEVG